MEQLKVTNNTAKIHSLFGKRLYSDKFSFISEICQNAVDSHRMAGIKDPVDIGIRYIDSSQGFNIKNLEFFVKDYGLSFSDPDDFKNKILTIAESGKSSVKTSDENCAMGEFGIGSISPSKYNDKWYYKVVTPNGMYFEATLAEIEGQGLSYSLTDMKKTSNVKSVEFHIPMSNDTTSDVKEFITALRNKLSYFKDINLVVEEDLCDKLLKWGIDLRFFNALFELFESDDFQISTMSDRKELHISMDQYVYPIRWTELGINPIYENIALKFKMAEGLFPDLTRENLQVGEGYKDTIMRKLRKVSDWFVSKYNSGVKNEYESIKELKEVFNGDKVVNINKINYQVSSFENYSAIKRKEVKFKDVSDLIWRKFVSDDKYASNFLKTVFAITTNGKKMVSNTRSPWYYYPNLIFLEDTKIKEKMMSYLKQKYTDYGICTYKKLSLKDFRSLTLSVSQKQMKDLYLKTGINIWRENVKQAKIILDSWIKDYITNINDIELPELVSTVKRTVNRKEKIDVQNLSGELGVKYLQRGSYSNYKLVDTAVPVASLSSEKFHIYGDISDRYKLESVCDMLYSWTKCPVKVGIISAAQQKYLQKLNLTNFMNVKDYMEGKHDSLRKVISSYMISKFLDKNDNILRNSGNFLKENLNVFFKDLHDITLFRDSHRVISSDPVMQPLLVLAEELDLYDPIQEKLRKLESDISNLDFLSELAPDVHPNRFGYAKELLQYRKTTKEWKNY